MKQETTYDSKTCLIESTGITVPWVQFFKSYLKFIHETAPIFYIEGSLLGHTLPFPEKIC